MGWRYLYFTSGTLVLVMSVARVTVIRFHETPKYLLCKGKDQDVINLFQHLAKKYQRRCGLTLADLERHGHITSTHSKKALSLSEISVHCRGLFNTKKLALSTTLVWLSWTLIGLAYPLFYVFLPGYLASRGAEFGETSPSVTWRNYVIAQVCSIFGPLLAGLLCGVRWIGRKYTMVIGAVITSESLLSSSVGLLLTISSDFLLRLYFRSQQCTECGVQLCSIICHQHLLRNAVRILTGGHAIGPSSNRQWNCCCIQSHHGYHVRDHCDICKHLDIDPNLHLCSLVWCHSNCVHCLPI